MKHGLKLAALLFSFGLVISFSACSTEPLGADATPAADQTGEQVDGTGDLGIDTPEQTDADVIIPLDEIGDNEIPPDVVDVDEIEPDEVDPKDEVDEVDQPICTMSCQVNADCNGVFGEIGVCDTVQCKVDSECQKDEDPENDKQCQLQVDSIPGCCDEHEDCEDDNVCTVSETCNMEANECVYVQCQGEECPEECCQNQVIRQFGGFENVPIGGMPPEEFVSQVEFGKSGLDDVVWSVQPSPCGSKALYLGDPVCKTYHNGQKVDCTPVEEIPCTVETEDVDCPDPLATCDSETELCLDDPKPYQVEIELVVPELNLTASALIMATFRLWMDAENVPPYEDIDFDALTIWARSPGLAADKQVFDSKQDLDENTTAGECRFVAIDLSEFSGMSIDLVFRFDSIDGTGSNYEGIYIDDLRIETYCTKDQCSSVVDCEDDNKCTVDDCLEFLNGSGEGICSNFKIDGTCEPCGIDDDCLGKGPYPEDPGCYIPTCIAETGLCVWPPNPDCCTEDDLQVAYAQGFETCTDDDVSVEEMGGSNGVKWQVLDGLGCSLSPDEPGFDTCSLYFGKLDQDQMPLDYDCGIPQCWGNVALPKLDFATLNPATFVKLTFCLEMSTEWDLLENSEEYPDNVSIDVLSLFVTADGEQAKEVWSSDVIAGSTHGEKMDVWVDLTEFHGKQATLEFRFDTGEITPANNNFTGVFVDEIRIETVCDEVCVLDGDCTGGGPCEEGICDDGKCVYETIPECCVVEDDEACDDLDECTADSCDVDNKLCVHTYNNDPSCCTAQAFVFSDNFEDGAVFDPLQEATLPNFWTVPKVNPGCGDSDCVDSESEESCPADCNQAPVSWHLDTSDQFSGQSALYFGNVETGSYLSNTMRTWGSLMSPVFMLPEYGTPKVTFKVKLDTEHCTNQATFVQKQVIDRLSLWVKAADGVDVPLSMWQLNQDVGPDNELIFSDATEIWDSMDWDFKGCTWDNNQSAAVWKTVEVTFGKGGEAIADLLKGKAVRYVLLFDSIDNLENDYPGVYVDDFSVGTVCDDDCYSTYDCDEQTPEIPDCSIEICNAGQCSSQVNNLLENCKEDTELGEYDFDGPCSMEGWTSNPPPPNQPRWQAHNGQSHSGTCSLFWGNPDVLDYGGEGTATSPTLDLSEFTSVDISFWMWHDLKDTNYFLDIYELHMAQVLFMGQAPQESVRIWAKPCNETFDCLQDPLPSYCDDYGCDTVTPQTWHFYTMTIDDLDAFYNWIPIGTKLAVFQLYFKSDLDYNNGEGIYFDDFTVSGY
jgi:hypothetical protein